MIRRFDIGMDVGRNILHTEYRDGCRIDYTTTVPLEARLRCAETLIDISMLLRKIRQSIRDEDYFRSLA